MAFRTPNYLKSMLSRFRGSSNFTTSTSPKMKAFDPTADPAHFQDTKQRAVKGDFVPVCVALGMVVLSTSLGLYTVVHQLKRCPNVHVRKSRRETLPELEEPDQVVNEAHQFINKSLFRKVAHVQEFDQPIPHPTRGEVLARSPRAETLKSVGVDPKLH